MTNGFRLLHAISAASQTRSRWRTDSRARIIEPIEIYFNSDPNEASDIPSDSHVSVLLGKNGEGKSRILSAVATTFQLLQSYGRNESQRGLPLSRLEYVAGGRHHVITCHGSHISVEMDGVQTTIQAAILPKRVIGLSMTPFDKFPIGSSPYQPNFSHPQQSDLYAYLGMRERMGRISTGALLTRALDGMVSRIALDDRGRLTEVFNLLGFLPRLDVVYRPDSRQILNALVERAPQDELLKAFQGGSVMRDQLRRKIENNYLDLDDLRRAASHAIDQAVNGFISVNFDLRHNDLYAIEKYQSLNTLRKAGLMRLYAVEAEKKNGATIDLKDASSGELSIAITFMSLAANLDDDSLILIDEPETNLHPEWQSQYLDLLLGAFSSYRNCHYVLATHSPLILADTPRSATLASLNNSSLQHGSDVSNRAVDYLLVEAFNVASGDNYYIQEQLIEALRLAADGDAHSTKFQSIVQMLTKVKPLIKDSPGIIELISDLNNIALKAANR